MCRFLFYKDSAPYKQYEALIERFKNENEASTDNSAEKYEPEMALEDDCDVTHYLQHNVENEVCNNTKTCKIDGKFV